MGAGQRVIPAKPVCDGDVGTEERNQLESRPGGDQSRLFPTEGIVPASRSTARAGWRSCERGQMARSLKD